MTLKVLPLWRYQREALDSLTGRESELIVLPTGGGKTFVFAHASLEFLTANPQSRVLVLVHTDELVQQAYEELLGVAPRLEVGIVKAARRDVTARVIVASVQTMRGARALAAVQGVGLIIVDEADLSIAQSYQTIMSAYPSARRLGVTATPFRADGKSLYPTWTRVAFQRDLSWMIRKKYLIPIRGKAIQVPDLDLRSVASTRTDFRDGDLGEALAESLAPELVAQALVEHAKDRKILAFFPTVASSYVFAEAIEAAGIPARVVHGGMSTAERREALAWHARGACLVNCQILTVGYNDPEVDCILMGRPTKSKRLYIQIVGRGARVDRGRPYEDQDCLLLDVVGANAIHGDLRSLADLSDRAITPEQARSGRSLTDLEDELDAGPGVPEDQPAWYTGEVKVSEFDPLGKTSSRVWIKTRGGTFFVPAGKNAFVFIMQWPEPGRWSVAWCGKGPGDRFIVDGEGIPRPAPRYALASGNPVGMTEHRGLDLEAAMVWAEDLAVDLGATSLNTAKKSASWRRKPPSEAMVGMARSLGIRLRSESTPSGLVRVVENAGEVSDKITLVSGSRRIDPIVDRVRKG